MPDDNIAAANPALTLTRSMYELPALALEEDDARQEWRLLLLALGSLRLRKCVGRKAPVRRSENSMAQWLARVMRRAIEKQLKKCSHTCKKHLCSCKRFAAMGRAACRHNC